MSYSFKRREKSNGQSSTKQLVNDGKWHTLEVWTRKKTVSITLDSNRTTEHTFSMDVHQFVNLNVSEYIFGNGFRGCLGAIRLNDNAFVLSSSNVVFRIQGTGVEQGCLPSDPCSHRPCQNNKMKYCVDTWESYKCVQPGLCSSQLCQNEGRCVPVGLTSFTCDCSRTQYGGKLCDVPLVCLTNPCVSNEQCIAQGPTFKCVVKEIATSSEYSVSYIVAIALSSLFIIVLCALGMAFLSSKRRWKEKELRVDVFKRGFENEAAEYDCYISEDERYTLNRAVDKPCKSLPDLRERPISILKTRYKSAENFYGADDTSPDDPRFRRHGHVVEADNIPHPTLESGFESSSSDEESSDYYASSIEQPELYDIECVSMQFSEMSFHHEAPPRKPRENINLILRKNYTNHGYATETDSQSDAYFTCSENEYATRRRNPRYIIAEEYNNIPRGFDRAQNFPASDTSSVATWSNTESTMEKNNNSNNSKRKRKRGSNLRQKVLKTPNKNNIKGRRVDKKLEQLSEAEEYV